MTTKNSPLPTEENISEQGIPTLPLSVLTQYVKDISFETPGPWALADENEQAPEISLNIEVTASILAEEHFEVALHVNATAKKKEQSAFVLELVYAGIFSIKGVEEANIPPILLIECPRLLFPFARNIVADLTREGGFPALSLSPVDFAAIYRQKMAEKSQA